MHRYHGRIIDEFVVCCRYHKEQDNTFFLQIFVKSRSKRKKKEEKYGKKGGNENVMMIPENHKTTNFVVRDLPLFQVLYT